MAVKTKQKYQLHSYTVAAAAGRRDSGSSVSNSNLTTALAKK